MKQMNYVKLNCLESNCLLKKLPRKEMTKEQDLLLSETKNKNVKNFAKDFLTSKSGILSQRTITLGLENIELGKWDVLRSLYEK